MLIFDAIIIIIITMVDTQIAAATEQEFERYTSEDGKWFFYHSTGAMSNSKELDKLQDLAGCDLPEVFYVKNCLYAAMPSTNVLLTISPVDSVSLSHFMKREQYLRKDKDTRKYEPDSEELFRVN